MSFAEEVALAVDLGTTTIAASLIDISTGENLATGSYLNPQRVFGADVVTRLGVAVDSGNAGKEMCQLVSRELENIALSLLQKAGRSPDRLIRIAVAGNPAMEHLLLGLPVDSLAHIPYRPIFSDGKRVRTIDLGWSLDTEIYIFPLPGGFVGGDLVAFLYGQLPVPQVSRDTSTASGIKEQAPRLYLDVGTNAEIALAVGERMYATSAAAGPAFEGGNLSCGMAALSGAISAVAINSDRLQISTIGGAPPLGICGSGVISAIVSLLDAGVLEKSGRLLSPAEISSNLANCVIERNKALAFLLHRDARVEIVLSQDDIRQVQLAKGAVRAGIEVLLERADVTWQSIGEIIVTGAFGNVMQPIALKSIGIVPPDVVERVRFIDEGVLRGCRKFLSDREEDKPVMALSSAIRVVPLSGNPRFEKLYLSSMDFIP